MLDIPPIRHNNHDRLTTCENAMGQAGDEFGGTRAYFPLGPFSNTNTGCHNGTSTRLGHGVKSGLWEPWDFRGFRNAEGGVGFSVLPYFFLANIALWYR
jgi:hypothetical protein